MYHQIINKYAKLIVNTQLYIHAVVAKCKRSILKKCRLRTWEIVTLQLHRAPIKLTSQANIRWFESNPLGKLLGAIIQR
jgi:hypothetical protein